MKKILVPVIIVFMLGFIVGIICCKNCFDNTDMKLVNFKLSSVLPKNIIIITIEEESFDAAVNENLIEEQKTDIVLSQNIEEILDIYYEFLKGNIEARGITIDDLTIPTGEEESRYPTKYAFSDVTRDGIPELHINSARYYYIFKYNNGELIRLLDLSPYPYFYALKNGGFISHRFGAAPQSDDYAFYLFDGMGNETIAISFSKYDLNQDYIYDDNDEYFFDGIEVTKEVWDGLTERYLYIDDMGIEQIRDEIEWTVLYD